MRPFTTAPQAAAPGLDLFAAAWLEAWTEKGGSVHVQPDGKAWIGFPEYELSRSYQEPPATLPEGERRRQRSTMDHAYSGAMRALLDLLETVPGGTAALKAHVGHFPSYALADGGKGVL